MNVSERTSKASGDARSMMMKKRLYPEGTKECPFCGSLTLYPIHVTLDGFSVPAMFCNSCKTITTVEGIEDYTDDPDEATGVLLDAWNRRPGEATA